MYLDEIYHVGVGHDDNPPGRGSGRFPYGSGENPGQHQFSFTSEVKELRKQGLKDSEIAKILLGKKPSNKPEEEWDWCNTTDLKTEIAIQSKLEKRVNISRARELYDKFDGNASKVGREMGVSESTVRGWLDPLLAERTTKYESTASILKDRIEQNAKDGKLATDVGSGTEFYLGVTSNTKRVAMEMLKREGYVQAWVQIPQGGTNNKTNVMVLAPPCPEGKDPKEYWVEIQKSKYNLGTIQEFTPDKGKTWWTPEFPESLSSKRVMIRYAEDGGKEKDGVIEINRDAKDLSLDGSLYSQVRIAVDGTHYMKGMAMYAVEKMPPGIDVIYNSNKSKKVPMIDHNAVYDPVKDDWSGKEVLKRMKVNPETGEIDRDNPFGALIKNQKEKDGVIYPGGQHHYIDENGKDRLSPINKLRDEGDWDTWSRNLSSQFLSKQPFKLIKQQIDLSVANKKAELEEINSLTNPVIKKQLLEEFASGCDARAHDLTVVGFKNQAYQVILPVPSLKDTECYAPNFKDGDTVALVRYPHGGVFEIPMLTVNNKSKAVQKIIGKDGLIPKDAVYINPKVAEQLSGADFDGDFVVTIPVKSNRLGIVHSKPLEGLKDFDPKELYKLPDSAPKMSNTTKQNEMGRITNLITDMTVQGASEDEICRAVKHSMVVIDAEKHHLDYKRSAKENDTDSLKRSYQKINPKTGVAGGASTVLSRARHPVQIDERKVVNDVNKMTPEEVKRYREGKMVYHPTGRKIINRIDDPVKMTPEELKIHQAGKKVYRTTDKLKQVDVYEMDLVDDAMDLVRDPSNKKEVYYAEYANALKGMANEARRTSRSISMPKQNPEAKKAYQEEVRNLEENLLLAKMNQPKERVANGIMNAIVSEKFKSNPSMDFEHRQREKARALNEARAMVGASKPKIPISDKEWEAIQANAISGTKLVEILKNTDSEALKQRATPRNTGSLTSTQRSLALSMLKSGMYTQKEIADRFGVSTSTISAITRQAN